MSRRGILAVTDYHIDRQKRLREGKGDPHGSPTLLVEAPDVPDDIHQNLRWEREYLGGYISADVLDYVPATSVAADIGVHTFTGRVEITGVVLDCTKRQARSGVTWARFSVQDRSGLAYCLGFGATASQVSEGAVGTFRGNVSRREEEVVVKVFDVRLAAQF